MTEKLYSSICSLIFGLTFFTMSSQNFDLNMQEILSSVLMPSGDIYIFEDSQGDVKQFSLDFNEDSMPKYRAYPFGNITISGSYKVATKITASVVIATSNVTLDLSGNTITGGIVINSGLSNIVIKNGTIDATSSGADGISASSLCSRIKISNVIIRNGAIRGIGFTNVVDSIIKNCEMTRNVTGVELISCYNIIVENCTASRNSQTGFGMLLSTTCTFLGCQALSTGDGNTNVINNNVFGFVSQNGSANIFNNCIANATQALSTTDYNSIVAGFALTGTERAAQIQGCQANHAMTKANGVTVPYGIYMQAQFSGLVTVTNQSTGGSTDSVSALSWTPDGQYLAVGGALTGNNLLILQILPATLPLVLTQVSSTQVLSFDFISTATIFTAQWSPSGGELAVGGILGGNDLRVFSFNRSNFTLTQIASINVGTGTPIIYTSSWSPDGQYLAVGGSFTTNGLQVFRFDRVALQLTQIASINTGLATDTIFSVAWSPNEQYLAVGGSIGGSPGNTLQLYNFNQSIPALALLTSVNPGAPSTVRSVAWSPDGQYVAAGGTITGNSFDIYKLVVSSGTTSLSLAASTIGSTIVESIAWSGDGRFLAVGGLFNGNNLNIYNFDRGSSTLNLLQSFDPSLAGNNVVQAVAWSPDGNYIATGGQLKNFVALGIYQALSFPHYNFIVNNTVSCASGGSNSGVGISGSSICNIIIQNTAFANPLNPSFASTSYQFVCNVFNQLFNDAPSQTQNLVMDYLQPIATPANYGLMSEQAQSLTGYIQSKIAFVFHSKFG